MTNKPESAAVEAVAWQARINEGHEWQSISEEAYKSITGWDKRALYPQSALDALRGEVERLRSHSERLSHELSEMAQVCGEAYQVVGILLDETEQFGSNHGDKILTNLWEGKLIHKDVVPWSFKGNRHG